MVAISKIYFRHGTMDASKSLAVLTVAHNYRKQGKEVLLFIPKIADRDGVGVISSRVGLRENAIAVDDDTNIAQKIINHITNHVKKLDCILIDEAQFLRTHHVEQLVFVADKLNIPVIAYGLLKDFRAEFFEGSKSLVLMADSIEEIKTVCAHPECQKKAIMILKLDSNGNPTYSGEQIEIGDAIYRSVCRTHYFNPEGVI